MATRGEPSSLPAAPIPAQRTGVPSSQGQPALPSRESCLPRTNAATSAAAQSPAGVSVEACLDESTPFEIEGGVQSVGSTASPIMHGRLKAHVDAWKEITTSSLVLSWVSEGFPLRWASKPPAPRSMPNHPSALQHKEFVTNAVKELLRSKVISVALHKPVVVSPLGVVPKKGEAKYRLIFDGRYVNEHLVIHPNVQIRNASLYSGLGTTGRLLFHSGSH